ncbi:MAG: hypothetical protein KBD37_09055 [Burkholderiales bacterium]|nr:hypothetical protein [Burkholderiales bacterium]
MDNVINEAPMIKVLKAEEVVLLNEVHEYSQRMREKSDELVKQTEDECEELKNELKHAQQQQLAKLSKAVHEQNQKSVQGVLEQLERSLYSVVYKVLNKLQINSFSRQQINDTIKNELREIVQGHKLIIQCNTVSLEQVQQNLLGIDAQVTYKVNNELQDEECVIDSGLSLIYIDLAQCRNKIIELLNHDLI